MVTVLVKMTVRAVDAPEFEETLQALMPLLRETEPETRRFDYYRVPKQDGVYQLLEVYGSREALDFHVRNPATANQRATFKRLLSAPADIQFLTPLGGK